MMMKSSKQSEQVFVNYRLKSGHRVFGGKKEAPQKIRIALGHQDDNPVYKYMKNERNKEQVLRFIMDSTFYSQEHRRTQSQRFSLDKTHSPNFRAFVPRQRQRCRTLKDVEDLRQQGEHLFDRVEEMGVSLRKKKLKLKILDQYIDTVDRYCRFLPKTYEQNEKEILIAHQEVRKLCTEHLFPEEASLMSRAASATQYSEPRVSFRMFARSKGGKGKKHRRLPTAPLLGNNLTQTQDPSTLSVKRRTVHF